MFLYTVVPGDSPYSIARRFQADPAELARINRIPDAQRLMVGQSLIIPVDSLLHTVTIGQTLYSIAKYYRLTVEALLAANPEVANPNTLRLGQVLRVPLSTAKLGAMDVNGYALPDISPAVLQATLPHLTYLSIFSHQVRADGSLVPIPDQPLIIQSLNAGVAPMMVITNIGENGRFSSELAHAILQSEAVQDLLLKNVVEVLDERNYYGLDIDFEYVYPQDREAYNRFIQKAAQKMHELEYSISTALAPKVFAGQPGVLYEAHDYAAHGAAVDRVILMTYEWGYTYGPAQAVAPIDQVERVLQFAVSVIPSEKILMGMPNYGYDWTLPFEPGKAARNLSNLEAIELASRASAMIHYDERVQAPWFEYYDSKGRPHVVWFDDARSIAARLALVKKYNLAGVSYWNINTLYPQNWIIQNAMYDVNRVDLS